MKNRKQRISIRRGFSITNSISLIIFIILFTFLQFHYMDDIFLLVQKKMMIKIAEEISSLDYQNKYFLSELSDIESSNSIYIEIYHPRDNLIYTTDCNNSKYGDIANLEQPEPRPRVMRFLSQEILEDGSYFEVRQELYASAQFLVYGTFFENDIGMEIYYPTDLIKDSAFTASQTLLILSCAVIILLFVIVYGIARTYLDPLQKITSATKQMAQLNFDEVCPPFRNKHMNELGNNINFLSGALSDAMFELKKSNSQLQKDIEAERKAAKAKRTFVANASHELKTPISVIRGYAEGMKYGIGCESTDEFCDIIIEESEKMNSLVVRLIEQLQYTSSYNLKLGEINIKELIENLIEARRISMKETGIALSVNIDPSFTGYGDAELLASVFNNYLSNALCHIDFEKKLIISCHEHIDFYRVSVFNSGKPIAGTDIENIWQSFYRADKAHSRKEGRFGLGLSIVSNIQDLHHQKYGVINHTDGVEFWFDIKKA